MIPAVFHKDSVYLLDIWAAFLEDLNVTFFPEVGFIITVIIPPW